MVNYCVFPVCVCRVQQLHVPDFPTKLFKYCIYVLFFSNFFQHVCVSMLKFYQLTCLGKPDVSFGVMT